jgi:hypothetical protein
MSEKQLTVIDVDHLAGVRPSMDAYGHPLRRPHMAARLRLTRRSGDPVVFNDHLASSLARLLRREHGIPFVTQAARSPRRGGPARRCVTLPGAQVAENQRRVGKRRS